VGCSSSPAGPRATSTNTPEKASVTATKSTPTLQPTPIIPCNNQDLPQVTLKREDNKVSQVQLPTGGADLVAFSSDSTKVYLSKDQGIYILNVSDARLICFIPNETPPSHGMTVSLNGSLLASVDIYGKITLRDAKSGVVIHEMQVALYQSPSRTWLEFSDDGSLLVSSGYFQPVTVWDTKSGQVILETIGEHATISPDGKLIALRGSNYTQIINIQGKVATTTKVDDKADFRYTTQTEPYFLYLLFSRDGNYLYGLNVYSEIKVWDVRTGELVRTANPCPDCTGWGWEIETPLMTLSVDGSKLLLVDPSQIILWDTQTWEKIMSENNIDFLDASISPDGQTIVTTSFQENDPIRFFYLK
jgi:WD40 repeat protein